MAAENIIARNWKRFKNYYMDSSHGENIIAPLADGNAMCFDAYREFCETGWDGATPKKHKMTLIPTNRRIVVFRSGGALGKDKIADIPLNALRNIRYALTRKGNILVNITEFVVPDNFPFKTIVFTLTTPNKRDVVQYQQALSIISGRSSIAVEDITDYSMFPDLVSPSDTMTITSSMIEDDFDVSDTVHEADRGTRTGKRKPFDDTRTRRAPSGAGQNRSGTGRRPSNENVDRSRKTHQENKRQARTKRW